MPLRRLPTQSRLYHVSLFLLAFGSRLDGSLAQPSELFRDRCISALLSLDTDFSSSLSMAEYIAVLDDLAPDECGIDQPNIFQQGSELEGTFNDIICMCQSWEYGITDAACCPAEADSILIPNYRYPGYLDVMCEYFESTLQAYCQAAPTFAPVLDIEAETAVPTLVPTFLIEIEEVLTEEPVVQPKDASTILMVDRNKKDVSTDNTSKLQTTLICFIAALATMTFALIAALLVIRRKERENDTKEAKQLHRLLEFGADGSTDSSSDPPDMNLAHKRSMELYAVQSGVENSHGEARDEHTVETGLQLPVSLSPPRTKRSRSRFLMEAIDDIRQDAIAERPTWREENDQEAEMVVPRPIALTEDSDAATPSSPPREAVTSLIDSFDLENSPERAPVSQPVSNEDDIVFEDDEVPQIQKSPSRLGPQSPTPEEGAWEEFQVLSRREARGTVGL